MADLTTSADVDAFLDDANFAAMQTTLLGSTISLSAPFASTGTSGVTLAAPSTGSPIIYTLPTTAATLARTDAAQTFTGQQTFSTGITLGTSGILLGGTNLVEQRNGTNAQSLLVYNTYTSGSVHEYMYMAWSGNVATFGVWHTGATQRQARLLGISLAFACGTTTRWNMDTSGHFVPHADNTYDAGSSSAAIRNVYVDGYQKMGGKTVASLTAASTAGAGALDFVTDSSTGFTIGIGNIVVGGGSDKVPVYSDGTNWRIG